ncbi:N-acetyltransferase [Mesorhizobium sp. 113-3-3]|nr:N-acetyltransferase [Mesorhizobium sp. 113-3-3]
MSTTIVPLAPGLWPDFEDLFGKQGACYGCWCTHFRLATAARRESSRERNKDHIKARIEAGPPPGLLALEDGKAVGWMQIGPRADVPEWNNKGRGSAPIDPADASDPAVWAISCFFIRAKARGRGITHRLVEGGIDFARSNGARSSRPARSTCRAIRARSAFSSARRVCSRRPGSRGWWNARRVGR